MRRSAGRGPTNCASMFLDDVRNMRANAVMIIGVLSFACLVWYHSEKMFGDAPPAIKSARTRSGLSGMKKEVVDIEQAMTSILANHQGVSKAATIAKQAVRQQHDVRSKYKATAIFVIKQPGTNLHLAMRNAAKKSFVREIVVLHDMSKATDHYGNIVKEWKDAPSDMYGKPVKYVKSIDSLQELHKFYACANHVRKESNVCYYQAATRDTEGYLESLWATFLRAPELLVTAAGATTFYNDLELAFREDSFGIDTAFAYLNAGAFFSKEHATNFVRRIDGLVGEDLDVESEFDTYKSAADVFFSLWLNKPPMELANDIIPYKRQIDEPKVYERNAFARRALQKEAHVLALKLLLEQSIKMRDGLQRVSKVGKVTNQTLAAIRPDAYSSCASDRCVLISNIPAVDPPSRHMDGSMIGMRLHELLQREVPTQECDVFKAHQYHYAVDGNDATQWVTTNANVSDGDYYGLDMLKLHKDLQNVTVLAAHPFQEKMVLEVSMGGYSWYPVPVVPRTKLRSSWRGFAVSSFTYDLSDALAAAWQRVLELPSKHHKSAVTPPLYIRYLRFRATDDYLLPLIVFDVDFHVGEALDTVASNKALNAQRRIERRPSTFALPGN
mmetsp:Transcript_95133/g.153418  ORF Transcript_95133/g.153418 Transcript_95133/m.153418 type:complete len:613 (-) Transcript_95133:51-1889(-)